MTPERGGIEKADAEELCLDRAAEDHRARDPQHKADAGERCRGRD